MLFFLSSQYCCFRSSELLLNSSIPKWGGRKQSHKNINIFVFQICSRNNKTSSFSLRNTLLRQNWMPTFLKQPWSIKTSTLCRIWENNLETSEKLFSMIRSGCSIYSHFLKPLHWNTHELLTVHSLRASNWTIDLLFVFLKFSWLLGYIFLNLFFISPDSFLIFHNIGMIYI